jgi:hypothetical protein
VDPAVTVTGLNGAGRTGLLDVGTDVTFIDAAIAIVIFPIAAFFALRAFTYWWLVTGTIHILAIDLSIDIIIDAIGAVVFLRGRERWLLLNPFASRYLKLVIYLAIPVVCSPRRIAGIGRKFFLAAPFIG